MYKAKMCIRLTSLTKSKFCYLNSQIGFKAYLTLKVEIEVEFDRNPAFHGNIRKNGMEIGISGVVSKDLGSEALFLEGSFFCGILRNGLSGPYQGLKLNSNDLKQN